MDNKILAKLSIEEKIELTAGTDYMFTNAVPRLGIDSVQMADGPHGLRKQNGSFDGGVSRSLPSTAFPTSATTACSFRPQNLYEIGKAIGEECRSVGVDLLLAPGVNIKRNPLCGRNFEYFSEDPLLSGKLGAAHVQGAHSAGVAVSLKHFALNNNENFRMVGNSLADQRALRELYLRAFRIVIEEAQPETVMCAYNKVDGVFCSENGALLETVLRGELGFDGAVVSDWGASRDRAAGIAAGMDLEMPGDSDYSRHLIRRAIKQGMLSQEALDRCVARILKLVDKVQQNRSREGLVPRETVCGAETAVEQDLLLCHHELARKVSADSAVLLKNDGNVFPLDRHKKIFVAGDLFEKMRYQGAGSSNINPAFLTSPKQAFDARGIEYAYARGYRESQMDVYQDEIDEALSAAKEFEEVLLFAGLTDYCEAEGSDRETLSLPPNQAALIDALLAVGKRVRLVLFGGAVMTIDRVDEIEAILYMALPGQNGGNAVADLLFGDVNPSGRTAETWVKSYNDVPFGKEFSRTENELYKESVFVGYRYYVSANKAVRFPFGYGLSYTQFDYGAMQAAIVDAQLTVSATVKNIGLRKGSEVVQLYVRAPQGDLIPVRELRAFDKVDLDAGESKRVKLTVAIDDLKVYDAEHSKWILRGGNYKAEICKDSETVLWSQEFAIQGDGELLYPVTVADAYRSMRFDNVTDEVFATLLGAPIPPLPKHKPVTVETKILYCQESFFGRKIYGMIVKIINRQFAQAKKMALGQDRDALLKGAVFMFNVLNHNCLRTMSMAAATVLPFHRALGLKDLINGHVICALFRFCMPYKKRKGRKKKAAIL